MKYTAKQIQGWDSHTKTEDGDWIPARPYSACGVFSRIKQAYGVLTGKYDALDWEPTK